mgnify:CR=1 FL=1
MISISSASLEGYQPSLLAGVADDHQIIDGDDVILTGFPLVLLEGG